MQLIYFQYKNALHKWYVVQPNVNKSNTDLHYDAFYTGN